MQKAGQFLNTARPTAVNLCGQFQNAASCASRTNKRATVALMLADQLAEEDVRTNMNIGKHGAKLLRILHERKQKAASPHLTHCNAGWLATVDRGTATAPICGAQAQGINKYGSTRHDREIREPRLRHGNSCTTMCPCLIVDNAGGL